MHQDDLQKYVDKTSERLLAIEAELRAVRGLATRLEAERSNLLAQFFEWHFDGDKFVARPPDLPEPGANA